MRQANNYRGGVVTQSLFQKTQGLIELLAQDPLRTHVITFLSDALSSNGEPVAVAFLQLSRDGELHVIAHEGFANFDPSAIPRIHIDSDRAVSEALRHGRLLIFSLEDRRTQASDLPKDLRDYWKSSVAIPIGLHSLYFLNFREDVTAIPEFEGFIRCIESLLFIFEREAIPAKSGKERNWFSEKPNSLSIRESRILELIRERKTNPEIAKEMGYSESLIRQETVSIYRKLGVSGRKEILAAPSKSNNTLKSVVSTAIALSGIEPLQPAIESIRQIQNLTS